jgi:8-oxo-dGTP pyrophosphatase MutT (NUDIX family)
MAAAPAGPEPPRLRVAPASRTRLAAEPRGPSPGCVTLRVAIRRLGYRLAYTGLRGYWFLARPSTRGVKCVLSDGGRVLLVRHTYGTPEWTLPGGRLKAGEPPPNAARRETEEELGLGISDWRSLGRIEGRTHHRRDVISVFMTSVDDPALTLDLGEIAAARWFARDRLPDDLDGYVPEILARADPYRPSADPRPPKDPAT